MSLCQISNLLVGDRRDETTEITAKIPSSYIFEPIEIITRWRLVLDERCRWGAGERGVRWGTGAALTIVRRGWKMKMGACLILFAQKIYHRDDILCPDDDVIDILWCRPTYIKQPCKENSTWCAQLASLWFLIEQLFGKSNISICTNSTKYQYGVEYLLISIFLEEYHHLELECCFFELSDSNVFSKTLPSITLTCTSLFHHV